MPAVCFYFQIHQPYRLKRYRVFDIGHDHDYWSGSDGNLDNAWVLRKVAHKSYLPANACMLELLRRHREFKISYSLTGVVLEQFEAYAPEVLDSFRSLVDTGRVELLAETYHHSLAFLHSREEFREQVARHRDKIRELFDGYEPQVFRNTELIYNNEVGSEAEAMGYRGVLAEGADHVLQWRSPDFVYRPPGAAETGLLLKNYKLSDDIAFRFSAPWWEERPLTAEKYAHWISAKNGTSQIINLFMDYETFGEHQWEDTGIFKFLDALPREVLKHPDNLFVTPSEALMRYEPVAELDAQHYYSWADVERDLSAWLSNPMQHDAVKKLYEMRNDVLASGDAELIEDWRRLQTSDHFYYMCTKWFADGDVHKYFNPYETPYEAFIAYMNALSDLKMRLAEKAPAITHEPAALQ